MAESTLSISYSDLLAEVGGFLGYGRASGSWTADELSIVQSVIASGLRNFYYPAPLPGQKPHVWSFLTPTGSIVVWPTYDITSARLVTGVHSGGFTTVTLTTGDGMFAASMVGKTITITGAGSFVITGYTSPTVITVAGDATCSGVTFSLTADGNYRLPDDFGGIRGNLTFDPEITLDTIRIASEQDIRRRRQSMIQDGRPCLAAVRPSATSISGSTGGQRFDLMLWPIPDSVYALGYRYAILAGKIDGTNTYPYGGAVHAETILESCLAVAEKRHDDTTGNHAACFMERMAASIAHDRNLFVPDTLGYVGDNSDGAGRGRGRNDSQYVTYNGVLYEGD